MARCSCSSTSCDQVRPCLSAGTGIDYNSSTGVISSEPLDCTAVRACISAGPGINYNTTTGVVRTCLSTQAGNALSFGPDNCLYAPATSIVTAACGLTGNGAPATPLAVTVGTWPFACDINTAGDPLYCNAAGELRIRPRGGFDRVVQQTQTNYPNVLVPNPVNTTIETQSVDIVNPSSCYDAFVLIEQEIEANFDLPPGSSAEFGIGTDAMAYVFNNGGTTQLSVHSQHTKVVSTIVPAGGTQPAPLRATMGRGTGGAVYNRVQTFIQAFIFNLS